MVLINLGTNVPIFPEDGIIFTPSFATPAGRTALMQFEITSTEPSFVLSKFKFYLEADGHNQNNILTTLPGEYFVNPGVRQGLLINVPQNFADPTNVRLGVQRVPLLFSLSSLAGAQISAEIDTDDTTITP